VVSLGSSTRSAARATSSALDRIPIRWRLAGASALLTLVILCAFAIAVGTLTAQRIHDDFEREVQDAADKLRSDVDVDLVDVGTYKIRFRPNLDTFVSGDDAAARLVGVRSGRVYRQSTRAPDLGPPVAQSVSYRGYRVENRILTLDGVEPLVIQYGRAKHDVEATVARVRAFLVGGVVGGAGLALLAGLMIARRAMRPIVGLSDTAREIERTRDPSMTITPPPADDEVAELARTLDGMLRALAASREEQEAMLRRQRQFVADASHELRTPLTSVLANLDFLAETLHGEQGEAAASALRSSQRMRRLVQDLLLLARADARRRAPHEPLDVAQVVVEAAAELEPVTEGHDLTVDAHRAMVDGARDELHRLVLNLMENAIRHTPDGTHIHASVRHEAGRVQVIVEDDGPGIPPELRDRVFERFVRGSGDRGGSFGLGLAIVRAVAESHDGQVDLRSEPGSGTRFTVTLPAAETPVPGDGAGHPSRVPQRT
jgi:two-component system, OmpR family, sensor kinase